MTPDPDSLDQRMARRLADLIAEAIAACPDADRRRHLALAVACGDVVVTDEGGGVLRVHIGAGGRLTTVLEVDRTTLALARPPSPTAN